MKKPVMSLISVLLFLLANQNTSAAENVVLITIDGLRWQELFRGLDYKLASNTEYSERSEDLIQKFWPEDPNQRAQTLMPFLHNVVFANGAVVGNRDKQSCARVSNPWYFSYPGYSEILTGIVDPKINTNDPIPNPHYSFMELLAKKPAYKGQSAVFSSWNAFPAIVNEKRSGIHVNAFSRPSSSPSVQSLNQLQQDIPSLWKTVRFDAFTHRHAMTYIKQHKPKIVYIAYGETDDFAHDGLYDQVVFAAQRTDRFIGEIWDLVNSMDHYRNNTALFITVDHGRGEEPIETWKHHASKQSIKAYMKSLAQYPEGIIGSEAVWMAAMGAGISNQGLITTGEECLTSNRIAATLMAVLGEDYREYNPSMGKPMAEFLKQ